MNEKYKDIIQRSRVISEENRKTPFRISSLKEKNKRKPVQKEARRYSMQMQRSYITDFIYAYLEGQKAWHDAFHRVAI